MLHLAKSRVRRRLGGARGAALVEAVVAIPFFIIIFASLMFVGRMYEVKERTMRLSKERAWAYAMGNCGTQGDSRSAGPSGWTGTTVGDNGTADLGSEGVDMSESNHTSGAPGQDILERHFGAAEAKVEANVVADGVIGGRTKEMRSRTKVLCNEPPYDGTLMGVARTAWRTLSRL